MTPLNQLKTIPDDQIQEWLRKVGKEHVSALVTALLGADEEVKNCVFRNMSERARAALKEDLEKMKIILNWAIKNRNICEFYYLKNYKSKDDLFSKVSVVSKISDEKIINIEVAALLR